MTPNKKKVLFTLASQLFESHTEKWILTATFYYKTLDSYQLFGHYAMRHYNFHFTVATINDVRLYFNVSEVYDRHNAFLLGTDTW